MRASDLLGASVRDADGADLGTVSDVRLVQDGPMLGSWGAALRVTGLVVSPRHTGSFLGYERGNVSGPWLVERIVKWLHRDAVYVEWDDVESYGDRVVRVRRTKAELPPVPALP
jgi:sporulation protein YlmC with PRC-barrel domain